MKKIKINNETKSEVITFRLNPTQAKFLKKAAKKNKCRVSTLIQYCIDIYLNS